MPIFVDTPVQEVAPIIKVTFADLVRVLPQTIPYTETVWVSGKIARYGQTTENLIFLMKMQSESSSETMQYFDTLVAPLGLRATASSQWKNSLFQAFPLYQKGELMIDKKTLTYTKLLEPSGDLPTITVNEVKSKLPATVPWTFNLHMTGGIVKNGFSNNDIDILVGLIVNEDGSYYFEKLDAQTIIDVRKYFTQLLGYKVDVGRVVMNEREPVYCSPIYQNGKITPTWQA